jgi:hypothetical protein
MAHISGASLTKQDDLNGVLITDELQRRPMHDNGARKVNALERLEKQLRRKPETMLHALMAEAMALCNAETVGLSVLRSTPEGDFFYWDEMAGLLAGHVGGRTPVDWSPCGTTLASRHSQLFRLPGRTFHYFLEVDPQIFEGLVVPVIVDGIGVATVWVVHHDDRKRFTLADEAAMRSLASFTAAAISLHNHNATATSMKSVI